jgi:hypothetical protein
VGYRVLVYDLYRGAGRAARLQDGEFFCDLQLADLLDR